MAAMKINCIQAKTPKENTQLKDNEEHIDAVDKDILRPFFHITSVFGNSIRSSVIDSLNYWLEVPADKLQIISDILFEAFHFCLLIDDIQDGSILRRGVPTAHTIFGVANTVITLTAIQARNLNRALSLNHPMATKTFTNSMLHLLAGQGMDVYRRDKCICPTEEQYLQVANGKNGGVFHLANNLMQLFATKKKNLNKFVTSVGWYFQINDDYQNLKSEAFFDSKGFCEDITEGKFGFPIVHAINSRPKEGELITDILSQRTVDIDLKKRCVSLIEGCGSFEYTRNKLQELRRTIFEEIKKLGANPYMDKFFDQYIGAAI